MLELNGSSSTAVKCISAADICYVFNTMAMNDYKFNDRSMYWFGTSAATLVIRNTVNLSVYLPTVYNICATV